MEGKQLSKILIIGGSGYIGKYMAKASVSLGHPTYVYARPITPQSPRFKLHSHKELEFTGVTIVQGDLNEHEKMVSLFRQMDIVISTLALPQVLDQLKIIDAIKVAGNIKRFIPSDFGADEDKICSLPPFEAVLEKKRKVRRAIETAEIPHTFFSTNCFGAYFINYLLRPHQLCRDIAVYGTGHAKAVLNFEEDIAFYTIKLANDPRVCNKIVTYRPPKNIVSQLQLISLWEKKTGLTFNRVHIPEKHIVELSKTLPPPDDIPVSILHSVFVKGDLTNYDLGEDDLEASALYPDYDYTSIEQLLDVFLVSPPEPAIAAFQ